ncbi:MAG: DUF4272 domain-containing protein [Lachnospiraceae bacterium]|nr:DUF4272 domain-containing protein [Lachnospiraceae bacterium]
MDKNTNQRANLTLYCAGSNLNGLANKVKDIFGANATALVENGKDKFKIKLIDESFVEFFVMSQPETMWKQNIGMANYFEQAPLLNKQVKDGAIQQMRIFTAMIGITFELNNVKERTNVVIGSVHNLARQITAFILYPTMELYHPEGKLLISLGGKTEFKEFYPIMCNEAVVPSKEENAKDKARREKNNTILKDMGLPIPDTMEVSAYDSSSLIPKKKDILMRAVALFGVSVKAEVYCSGKYDDPVTKSKELLDKLEELYGVSKFYSEEEKSYVEEEEHDSIVHNKFGWRYECCATLLWALSLLDMKKPNEICDAGEIGKIIWQNDFKSLMDKAVVRDRDEILDMQDLAHRYDWACIECQIKKQEITELNSEIVLEWHYALNWLTGVDGVTDWDKVPRRA